MAKKKQQTRTFADKLKEYREASGFNQNQLAERIGMTRANVSTLETGRTDPKWSTVQLIARVLGVSEVDLRDDALMLPEPKPKKPRGRPKKKKEGE